METFPPGNERENSPLDNVRHYPGDEKDSFRPTPVAVVPSIPVTVKDLEILRKLLHMFGSIIAFIYLFAPLSQGAALVILSIYAAVMLGLDIARNKVPSLNRDYISLFGLIMRKNELDRLNASTYFVLGSLFVIAFCPRSVAAVSILYLAFGDPVAAIVGIRFGRTNIFGKSIEGSGACFLVCFSIGLFFFAPHVAVIGAFFATISELVPLPIDDNFRIPVISALGLMLVL